MSKIFFSIVGGFGDTINKIKFMREVFLKKSLSDAFHVLFSHALRKNISQLPGDPLLFFHKSSTCLLIENKCVRSKFKVAPSDMAWCFFKIMLYSELFIAYKHSSDL